MVSIGIKENISSVLLFLDKMELRGLHSEIILGIRDFAQSVPSPGTHVHLGIIDSCCGTQLISSAPGNEYGGKVIRVK